MGDRAIVLGDGRMQGFVGGACARDIVRRQAIAALRSGAPRLVQIRPNAPPDADDFSPVGTVVVPMSCRSEGAVDVYVEPHLAARTLLVAGATPIAVALSRLGALLDGYRVVRVLQDNELPDALSDDAIAAIALPALGDFVAGLDDGDVAGLSAVVATQGHYDEPVLQALLSVEAPPYVGLLASRKRAADLFAQLERSGIARERIRAVRNPAGLDLGARRPGDVAISILAQIVATATAREGEVVRQESVAPETMEHACCMEADPQ